MDEDDEDDSLTTQYDTGIQHSMGETDQPVSPPQFTPELVESIKASIRKTGYVRICIRFS